MITLVAVFMLFVVGAMAALSVDVESLYTARSEAQIVADSAALAAARVLANSGATSDSTGALMTAAEPIATQIAYRVAVQNQVGGRALIPGPPGTCPGAEICVTYNQGSGPPYTNPQVTVTAQRADLPTFFARIWGTTKVAISASATAEAYNPSGGTGTTNSTSPPVAPVCVKPWLLPNLDPSTGGNTHIFDSSGDIVNSSLLGWTSSTGYNGSPVPMTFGCLPTAMPGICVLPGSPSAWGYLPGDNSSFPAPPSTSVPGCSPPLSGSNYQYSIAGCVPLPISCNSGTNPANVDINDSIDWNAETADAANCVSHATAGGGGDTVTVTSTNPPSAPFEFTVGSDNPLALVNPSLAGADTMVSDSLVTVPIFDTTSYSSGTPSVSIIGFVQLFLNPTGVGAADSGSSSGQISTTIVNLVGCAGTSAGLPPIIGNGAGPVAVRLISPP